MTTPDAQQVSNSTRAAFGAANRARLLDAYFAGQPPPSLTDAWKHVYRLLLWADQTTGLAHCYESDKSQPGKHWYPRALAFHAWVADALSVSPRELGTSIDWLFQRAAAELAGQILRRREHVLRKAQTQLEPYADREFPEPGEDPELVRIIDDVLSDYLSARPQPAIWRTLVERVRQHLALENKRRNLVGEGFEDVLHSILIRTTPRERFEVSTRRILQTVPGFKNAKAGEKANKVDLVVLSPHTVQRTLVTAKWSIRADREKQFTAEFASYVAARSDQTPFQYVLVTNEFDPARLVRACEGTAANGFMFTNVVHINTDALIATYGNSPEDSMKRVVELIRGRRLLSLSAWIGGMVRS